MTKQRLYTGATCVKCQGSSDLVSEALRGWRITVGWAPVVSSRTLSWSPTQHLCALGSVTLLLWICRDSSMGVGGTMIVISKGLFRTPKCGEGALRSRSSENGARHCCQGGREKGSRKKKSKLCLGEAWGRRALKTWGKSYQKKIAM